MPHITTPQQTDSKICPAEIRATVGKAKSICADLTRVQYQLGIPLYEFMLECRRIAQNYESVLSENDLGALELAYEVSESEIRRRDALCSVGAPIRATAGLVYLLRTSLDFYKIGCSTKPQNRLLTFGVQLPFEVEVVCAIFTEDMYALEGELHRHFADRRVRGEWFKLSAEDVKYIEELAK